MIRVHGNPKPRKPWEFTALAETRTGNIAREGLANGDLGYWGDSEQSLSLSYGFLHTKVKATPSRRLSRPALPFRQGMCALCFSALLLIWETLGLHTTA